MTEIQDRKKDHLTLCASDDVSFRKKTSLFEEVELIHSALPGLSLQAIDTNTVLMGKTLRAPLLIGSMTGGTGDNSSFNADLAAAAEALGIGMCLGSLRPGLENARLKKEFQVRKHAPTALILANIGGAQLKEYPPGKVIDAAREIGADGIIVHLNTGMELIQPGGDTDFTGIIEAIAALIREAGRWPVSVKETGMGLSFGDGEKLKQAGVSHVETAGAGGTSWIGVETCRASGRQKRMGEQLWDLGIPTAVSTAWMSDLGFTVISSGGVYTGLDMARAIAMGATATAIARPLVIASRESGAAGIAELLEDLITGLRYTMMIVGAADLASLRRVPRVLGSRLTSYIETGWIRP